MMAPPEGNTLRYNTGKENRAFNENAIELIALAAILIFVFVIYSLSLAARRNSYLQSFVPLRNKSTNREAR